MMILLNLLKRIRTIHVFNTKNWTIVSIMKGGTYQNCYQSIDHCHFRNKNLLEQSNTKRKKNILSKHRINCK